MNSDGENEEELQLNASSAKYSLPALTPAKRIYVYKNGDTYFAGKQVLVNPRYTRTWNAFLEQLNQSFKLSTGAVQRLHTPLHGHAVADFKQLESGSDYVVSGPERFRRLNYNEIRTRNLSPPKSRKKELLREINEAKPVVHSKIQAEPRVKAFSQPKTVYFYRNGDEYSKATLMLLRTRDMQTWEQILQVVSDKIMLSSNTAIRRIYKMSGEEIHTAEELENNQFYVVAGHEKFIPTDYGHLPRNLVFVPTRKKTFSHVKFLSQIPTPPKQESFSGETAHAKPVEEENNQKPAYRRKVKKQQKPVDYDQDSSGVFRARRPHEETRNARTIDIEERHEQDLETEFHDESANRTHRVRADSNENVPNQLPQSARKTTHQSEPEVVVEHEVQVVHENENEAEIESEAELEFSNPATEAKNAVEANEPERKSQQRNGDQGDDDPESDVRGFVFGARSPAESAEPAPEPEIESGQVELQSAEADYTQPRNIQEDSLMLWRAEREEREERDEPVRS